MQMEKFPKFETITQVVNLRLLKHGQVKEVKQTIKNMMVKALKFKIMIIIQMEK